jgi:hypothetical protein
VNKDTDDIEGCLFIDWLQRNDAACASLTADQLSTNAACAHPLIADPQASDWSISYPLTGRPVGFNMRLERPTAAFDQVVAFQIIYNTCNCPASTYVGDAPVSDMQIYAVSTPTNNQVLAYQKNTMEMVYGQDCGGYTVTLQPVDPSCDKSGVLTAAAASGTGGSLNKYAYSQ